MTDERAQRSRYFHREAFCLMTYQSEDKSETETLWNSRDGAAPFMIISQNGVKIRHIDGDVCSPDHVPNVGDRVFVDITESRAHLFATRRVEFAEANDPAELHKMFESREAALQSAFENEYQAGAPDILVVTSGFIDELLESRQKPSDGADTMGLIPATSPNEPGRARTSIGRCARSI